MIRTTRTVVAATLAALVVGATLVVAGVSPSSAATLNAIATTANPSNNSFLASGGSETEYTLTLPPSAACSGDTAHDGYHVWSYLVQPSVDISSLTFNGSGPSTGYGIFDSTGSYYGPVNTAQTTGEIVGIPTDLEWGPAITNDSLLTDLLYTGGTSGVWEAGLACANSSGVLTDNWNFQITFTSSETDPDGFTWSAVPGPQGSTFAAITSADSTSFTDGSASSFTPTATGTPAPTITEDGPLPTGVSFTGGKLTGTPTESGTFPITFTATNGIGNPATQDFTLTVGGPPSFTSADSAGFAEGVASSFTPTANGFPAPTITEAGPLPAGITFTGGALTGTPTETGAFPITFTASNGISPDATQDFTLTVGVPPAFTSADSTSFTEGSASSFTPAATGPPAPTITEAGPLPTGITFTGGKLTGTPTESGTFPITFTASNGIAPDATQDFTLTVGVPPAFTSGDSTTFTEGSASSFTPAATGTPAPTITEAGPLPTGITFTGGALTGTPTESGTFPVTFTASNGIAPDATQDFTLTVDSSPAFTSAASASFTEGTVSSFTPTASGTPAPTITEAGALPTGITFTGGKLTGTPTATGGFPITFTATNGVGDPATQDFTLTVASVPAITSGDSTTFTEGSAGSFTPTATGTPAPTFTEAGPLPTGVSFTDGALAGTSTESGVFPITFTASNGAVPSATQHFTLTVTAPAAITSANSATFVVGSANTFTVTTAGTPTPSVTEAGALPGGVTFDPATGVLSGDPTAAGSFPLTFTATNGIGSPAVQSFTLTSVSPPPVVAPTTLTQPVVGIAGLANGAGYVLADSSGDVAPFGSAQSYGSLAGTSLNAPIVSIALTPSGHGYWLVAADGGVFAFGDAGFHGSMGGIHLNAPIVGIAPTPSGNGYWLVAADGGVFAFGDAGFHGSMGGIPLNKPVVGMAADAATGGYWLVAADGGIFSFGAPFAGSTGAITLNKPVTGMAPSSDGNGYWLAASDGGVFAFGDAGFHGSMGGVALNAPIVGVTADHATGGYWLLGNDGGVFSFDAPFYGAG